MNKSNFDTEYNDLKKRIILKLRSLISNSNVVSKHIVGLPCIKVNIFDYCELVIWNNNLTFITNDGLHSSLLSDCDIEDLIEIIKEIETKKHFQDLKDKGILK